MENRCIRCGEIIPEGRQVCPACSDPDSKEKPITEILEAVELVVKRLTPAYLRLFPNRSHEILVGLESLIKKNLQGARNER